MMVVLSAHDIRRLSPTCRAELLALLALSDGDEMDGMDRFPLGHFHGATGSDGATATVDDVLEEKVVVDLSVDEARDLVANIQERSKETLKLFASGKPVALSVLVGTEGEYRDYSELKRSFVGAVNRRLRTVSGNRNAALFSSDREKTRIRTTPKTSRSLRCVFNLPEPLPEFEFTDREGKPIDVKQKSCEDLKTRLSVVWSDFTGRPDDQSAEPWVTRMATHFVKSGFELFVGTPTGWDEAVDSTTYEIHTVDDPFAVIRNSVEDGYPHKLNELFFGLGSDAQVIARPNL